MDGAGQQPHPFSVKSGFHIDEFFMLSTVNKTMPFTKKKTNKTMPKPLQSTWDSPSYIIFNVTVTI